MSLRRQAAASIQFETQRSTTDLTVQESQADAYYRWQASQFLSRKSAARSAWFRVNSQSNGTPQIQHNGNATCLRTRELRKFAFPTINLLQIPTVKRNLNKINGKTELRRDLSRRLDIREHAFVIRLPRAKLGEQAVQRKARGIGANPPNQYMRAGRPSRSHLQGLLSVPCRPIKEPGTPPVGSCDGQTFGADYFQTRMKGLSEQK